MQFANAVVTMSPAPPTPTIVLGCYHSGTRAVVSLLNAMGSFGGPIDNPWLEHSVFLDVHAELMKQRFGSDRWSCPELLTGYQDDLRVLPLAQRLLRRAAPRLPDVPRWHWKNPRSTYFLRVWQVIYPEAQFVHIIRDGRDVAVSLYHANCRAIIPSLHYGFALWEGTVRHILENLPKRTLTVHYERLDEGVPRIADRLLLDDRSAITRGKSILRIHAGAWREAKFNPRSPLLEDLGYH